MSLTNHVQKVEHHPHCYAMTISNPLMLILFGFTVIIVVVNKTKRHYVVQWYIIPRMVIIIIPKF
jgi:hypothetical protein